jgi:CRP/FNR family cyclic AMP-dependent transcriptional regulator
MQIDFLSPGGTSRVAVLHADPELAGSLAGARRARAERLSAATVLRHPAGTWDAKADADLARNGFGLLVLDGVLVRRVGAEERVGAELLGPGDLLQPSLHDGEEATLPFEATWRVLSSLRLAILDGQWVARMAPFPEVGVALLARTLARSRRLASMLAITHYPRLDDRLWLFFWEVADRFGRVRPDGVVIDVPLTHEVVSHLVGARRPSVSAALARLEHEGRLHRSETGWLLIGEPPQTGGSSDPAS